MRKTPINLSIRTKQNLILLIMVLLMSVLPLFAHRLLTQDIKTYDRILENLLVVNTIPEIVARINQDIEEYQNTISTTLRTTIEQNVQTLCQLSSAVKDHTDAAHTESLYTIEGIGKMIDSLAEHTAEAMTLIEQHTVNEVLLDRIEMINMTAEFSRENVATYITRELENTVPLRKEITKRNELLEFGLLGGIGLFALVGWFIGFIFSNRIFLRPLKDLSQTAAQLATGDITCTIPPPRSRDEIGILSTAFRELITYLQEMAAAATEIAQGNLSQTIRPRSEHDILSQAFLKMLGYLTHIATVAEKITRGDLTGTVQMRSTIDVFGEAIRTMTEGLHTLIVQIRTSADQIASTEKTISSLATHDITIVREVHTSTDSTLATLEEMGRSVVEVAGNMEVLSSSVAETSAAVAQMATSITNIAANTTELTRQTEDTIAYLQGTMTSLEGVIENTDLSKQLSQDAMQDARAGQEAVEQVTQSMEGIHTLVTTAVESIKQFAQRSRDIDMILEVIRDITEQTALLALNAAIIAAQAGEHGRGFAVVAAEIRSLADGVGNSTKDIATIVQTLQQDTNQVVQVIYEGAEKVKQGMERTQQARQTLQKILTSAERSSLVIGQSADTLHDLMAASQTVSTAMEQVNTMTDDITAATAQHEASTKQIKQAIVHINDMTSQIQQATTEQLTGVEHVLGAMRKVIALADQNLESSQGITNATAELSAQADLLLQSVDSFTLNRQ